MAWQPFRNAVRAGDIREWYRSVAAAAECAVQVGGLQRHFRWLLPFWRSTDVGFAQAQSECYQIEMLFERYDRKNKRSLKMNTSFIFQDKHSMVEFGFEYSIVVMEKMFDSWIFELKIIFILFWYIFFEYKTDSWWLRWCNSTFTLERANSTCYFRTNAIFLQSGQSSASVCRLHTDF